MSASIVAGYIPVQPFSAAILSLFIFGSDISVMQLVGGGLIIAGLLITIWPTKKGLSREKRMTDEAEELKDMKKLDPDEAPKVQAIMSTPTQ